MKGAAIVVAGGSGRRMGGRPPKQFLPLGGIPVLRHALGPFIDHPGIRSVVVVLPAAEAADPPGWLADLPVSVCAGGAERGDSVRAGLAAVPGDADRILVHDAARPLVPADVVDRVFRAAAEGGAIAALPVADTIQEVDAEGVIIATPDRSRLYRAQTPQGFPGLSLAEAYRRAAAEEVEATDDAAIYARFIGPVRIVAGDERSLKITGPEDLRIAELFLSGR